MALPVNDIIAQLQRGNQGDVGDGEAEDGGEEGEEVVAGEDEGDGRKYIEDVELEIIDGNKHGKWLVINQVHIAFKGKGSLPTPKRMNFRKIILRISRQKCVILRQKCVCSLWQDCYILYDPNFP